MDDFLNVYYNEQEVAANFDENKIVKTKGTPTNDKVRKNPAISEKRAPVTSNNSLIRENKASSSSKATPDQGEINKNNKVPAMKEEKKNSLSATNDNNRTSPNGKSTNNSPNRKKT